MNNRFFRPNIANELLQNLIHADWESVNEIVKINPYLISQNAKAIDINGNIIEISPLLYALRVNDIFAINIFKKYFSDEQQKIFETLTENHPEMESGESPRNKAGRIQYREMIYKLKHHYVPIKSIHDFLLEYTKPDLSNNECFNLQPFFWVYECFIDLNFRKTGVKSMLNAQLLCVKHGLDPGFPKVMLPFR